MKLAKRGILFVFFVFILVNAVYAAANVNTNLTINKFGPNSPFDGYLRINFTGFRPLDAPVSFHSGSLTNNIPLTKLFNVANLFGNPNLIVVPEAYTNSTNSEDSTVTVNFANPGSNASVGIDLRGNPASPRQPGDVSVQNISFTIEPISGSPNDVSIYIGGSRVYRYRGNETGWSSLERPHLGNDLSPTGSGQDITGNSIFCQLLNVTDSGQYRINISAKKIGDVGTTGLNATMIKSTDGPLSGPPDCGNPETPCCSFDLSGITTTSFGYTACQLTKVVPERRGEYLCVYPTNPTTPETRYFSIGIKASQPVTAFVNGISAESNFYIFGDYRTYSRSLTGESSVNFSADDYINSYIHRDGCTSNCLLVPFNITLNSSGSIKLKNLVMPYTTSSGSFTGGNFRKIYFVPQSASYNGTINTDLSKLYEVVAPSSLGSYQFYVAFDGTDSNHVDFDVVPAPTAFIRYGPFNPGIREAVQFDGSGSSAPSGENITSYLWNFGDNINATGVNTTHLYNATGNYIATLKVTDSEGVYGIDRVTIQVQNASSTNVGALLNSTFASISSFRTTLDDSPTQVKDTANLLGINQLLNNIEANLTAIRTTYDNIIANTSIDDTQKSVLTAPLLQQINSLTSHVPSSLNVDTYSFSGKVTGINQIASCCEFQSELQKTKLLTSQQGVTINAEARVVNEAYADGRTESFIIVKKDIIGTGTKIYEFVPFGLSVTPNNILVGGNVSAPSPNVYSFSPVNQLVYKVDSTDISKALQTRTAVLPSNLESVQVNASTQPNITFEASVCGNNICESDESTEGCPVDCKAGNSLFFVVIGVVIALIILIVYFGLFFKGGLFKKGLSGSAIKAGGARQLFKADKDYAAVKDFIENSLRKGLNENQITVVLKSKGWNDTQITSVINEVKTSKSKPAVQIKH